MPAKPARRTTFCITLLFNNKVGSILSLEDATN